LKFELLWCVTRKYPIDTAFFRIKNISTSKRDPFKTAAYEKPKKDNRHSVECARAGNPGFAGAWALE